MKLQELEGKKVGICVSGGLDSKTVATRLRQAGVECVAFTADLAQPDEDDIENVREKMQPTGVETVIVSSETAGAELRYTTDGSSVDESSPEYMSPFEVGVGIMRLYSSLARGCR